jgi:tetratricopeptide (TPR) repeat protein
MPRNLNVTAAILLGLAMSPQLASSQAGDPAGRNAASRVHVIRGDSALSALAPAVALRHYEAAIATNREDNEAHWKAAQAAVDIGEFHDDAAYRTELFRKAEAHAQRAVELRPDNPEAHFHLARATGMVALSVGIREKVTYATAIHTHATNALRLDPDHPGALHVLGVWHAEVMRLNALERMVARQFLGAKVLGEASWDVAVRSLERAVAVDPRRLTHHLSLARIYRDMKQTAKARERYQHVIRAPATSFNDPVYKRAAERELARLR